MSVTVCLSLDSRTKSRTKTRRDVGRWEEHHDNYTFQLLLDICNPGRAQAYFHRQFGFRPKINVTAKH